MTRWMLGKDYLDVACIKITRDDYDPRTTPDEEREKFFYSTKWGDYCSPTGMSIGPVLRSPQTMVKTTVPMDANAANWEILSAVGGDGRSDYSSSFAYSNRAFKNLYYDMPFYWVSYKDASTGRFIHNRNINRQQGEGNFAGVSGGYWESAWARSGNWRRNQTPINFGYWFPTLTPPSSRFTGLISSTNRNTGGGTPGADNNSDKYIYVFNLPGNDEPLKNPPLPPTGERKMSIQINSQFCRVAKTGYDVRTATPSQLVFNSDFLQARTLAVGDGPVPGGQSFHELGTEIPENAFAMVHFYYGSTILYPSDPSEQAVGADYWFDGTKIRFQNPNPACRARYIVLSYDETPPTTGVNRVFRQFTENGEKHVQLLRPGAGDPPSFADILVDSRFPVPQIIKEGYIPVTGTGAQTHTITYDTRGLFPMVIYTTHHPGGSDWDEEIRLPTMYYVRWQSTGGTSGPGGPGGNATYVTYNGTTAVFRTFRGLATNRWISGKNGYQVEYDPNPIKGIRYYVLGIPIVR